MLTPVRLRSFDRDLARSIWRNLDVEKLKKVMECLISEKPLEAKYKNHRLRGNFVGYWECHVMPDWLLVYKKDRTHIYFTRLGTHSDLFD